MSWAFSHYDLTMKILAFCIIVIAALLWVRVARGDEKTPDFGRTPDLSGEVWYQIMPIAWRDSGPASGQKDDPHRFGDLKGIAAGLPYLQSMGFTGIWITPPFVSRAYHGYQHGPADEFTTWLGNESDWRTLVQACHDAGLKIFVDFVAYGISTDSKYFKDAHENPKSEFSSWLAFKDAGNKTYRGYEFTTWNKEKIGIVWWDLRKEQPRQQVTDWATKLLKPSAEGKQDGVDGFRLDHVWTKYAPAEDKATPDGWGYNLDSFWTPWKLALRSVDPEVITFAEQAKWETTGADLLGPFDAAFSKPFQTAVREALLKEDATPLYAAMERTLRELNPIDDSQKSETATDEITAKLRTGKFLKSTRENGNTFLAVIGDHDVDRIGSSLGFDEVVEPGRAVYKAKVAAAIQMLQPFPPCVYMGDEIGMRGKAGKFGTDSNDIPRREPFKWNATDSPPMTAYWELDPRTVEKRYSKDKDGLSVEEQLGREGLLLETYRELISLRKRIPALSKGGYFALQTSSPKVWCFARRIETKGDVPGQTVIVVINIGQPPQTFTIDFGPMPRDSTECLVGTYNMENFGMLTPPPRLTVNNQHAYVIDLPSYGVGIYVLQ